MVFFFRKATTLPETTKKTKRNNQNMRAEGLSNLSKDPQSSSRGAGVLIFIFLHEAKPLLCDENIHRPTSPREWLQHGIVRERPDEVAA